MESVWVNLDKNSYPIFIGKNFLEGLKDCIDKKEKYMVITDENVNRLYGKRIETGLPEHSLHKYVLKPGEESKTLDMVEKIIACMIEQGFTRNDKIIALGGGVVGDIAGFCASIYMRGIDFIQVPTTLLAQVDSSVGGKTGVNMPQGKNLVGTFYQPNCVIVDTSVLGTLSSRELLNGLGEMIKYGLIADNILFEDLKMNIERVWEIDVLWLQRIIKQCCSIKARIVTQDEREGGLRKILNYGHTIGHALEAITEYKKYAHGEAVLIGMYHEAIMAKKLGWIEENVLKEITACIESLPVNVDISLFSIEKIINVMSRDKKNQSNKISFILPIGRGRVKEHLISKEDVKKMLTGRMD
ncbi:3-dehydroquinate synthase [Clostridiaceae bacterium 35-E11]